MSIELQEVTRTYKLGKTEIRALRNISLTIEKAAFVAIVGPSGCGKSTLLNQIGSIDQPTVGAILVDGQDITKFSAPALVDYRLRKVGFIFQFNNLATTLNAADNVELPMIFLGKPRIERKQRVKELLSVLGLSSRMTHRPDNLSGGERQRLAIAVALANDPAILLADEPTGELDSEHAAHICEIFTELNQAYGKTIILVTHNPTVASYAHKIIHLKDGQFIRTTSPQLRQPFPVPSLEATSPLTRDFGSPTCQYCGSSDLTVQKNEQMGLWIEQNQRQRLLILSVLKCTQCHKISYETRPKEVGNI